MKIGYFVLGGGSLLVTLWALYWLIYLGMDGRRMMRRIKDGEHPPPDERRNIVATTSQLGLMNMANIIAATLAGIGASMFVDGGRFRFPSSDVPYALIIVAASLTLVTGTFIGAYITRPARAWIFDTSDFRAYLRQIRAERRVSQADLIEIRKRRSKWEEQTRVRPLRSPNELSKLGLELSAAADEWASLEPRDPAYFGAEMLGAVKRKQVWRWIIRKRFALLGAPPLIAGFTISAVILGASASMLSRIAVPLQRLVVAALLLFCISILYWIAFRVGRLDLVMTNRYVALERKQLRDCVDLIDQIEAYHSRDDEAASLSGADGNSGTLVFRIGRWDLRSRSSSNGTRTPRR